MVPVDRGAKTLSVELKPPGLIRPNAALHIPVKVAGFAAGEEARVVVAAVDVGILNLDQLQAAIARLIIISGSMRCRRKSATSTAN